MNTMFLVSGLLLVSAVVAGVLCVKSFRRADYEDLWVLVGVVLAVYTVVALIFGVGIPVNTYVGRAYGHVECRNWGHQTQRPVRFVTYTSWSTGECLTRDNNGKWISKDQLRQFAEGK